MEKDSDRPKAHRTQATQNIADRLIGNLVS
jgi:hypothetical protein